MFDHHESNPICSKDEQRKTCVRPSCIPDHISFVSINRRNSVKSTRTGAGSWRKKFFDGASFFAYFMKFTAL
jgi:hypothetical protein